MKKSTSRWAIACTAVVMSTCFSIDVNGVAVSKRLAGANRYQTAVAVSKEGWQYSNYAVIVTGENYPDALSAAPLAVKYNCPILLSLKDNLDVNTSVELKRLKVTNAFIVGGTGVISKGVEDKLTSMGIKVQRYAGATRYDTAIAVANAMGKTKEAVLVNGEEFTDALSIAPIAAAKGMPIVLTTGSALTPQVQAYLTGTGKTQVYVMGGQEQIAENVVTGLPNVKRILGRTAYERNTAAINAFAAEVDFGTTYIATGKDYPDGLTGAVLAAKTKSPLILLNQTIPEELKKFFDSKLIQKLNVLGGAGAVSYDLEKAVKLLPLEVSSTNNIIETITQNQSYTPPKTILVTTNDNNKNELPIKWNLTRVDTTKPGIFTFTGKVEGYDSPITLTLYVKPVVYKVDDITAVTNLMDTYVVPDAISAQMSDGSVSNVPITWSYPSSNNSKPGVYVFSGKIDGYAKPVKLTLTVNPESSSGNPDDPDDPNDGYIADVTDEVIQDQKYTPQKYVTAVMKDGAEKKLAVSWAAGKVDTSILGKLTIDGTVTGYNGKVKLTLTIKPKVLNTNSFSRSVTRNYPYTLPTKVRVEMTDHSKPLLPVSWALDSVDTSSLGTFVIKGNIDTYGDPITAEITVMNDSPVSFLDSNLEEAVRAKAGKTDPARYLYRSEVEGIKELDLSGKGIQNITGLSALASLQTLNLSNNNVIDLTELSTLRELQFLNLSNNNVINVNALNRLIYLKELNLSNNNLRNVTPLGTLNELEKLYLSGNPVSDFGPIIYYYGKLRDKDFSF